MRSLFTLGLFVIGVVALSGCDLLPVVTTPVTETTQTFVVPTSAIIYQQAGQIWLAEADGSNPQAVSSPAASTYHPTWVPHTDSIIYGIVHEPYFELWLHNLGTGKLQLLTAGRIAQEQIAVAPNGQYVTYIADTELYLLDLVELTTTRLDEHTTFASWSPDSRIIVFSTTDNRLLQRQFRATGELDSAEVLLDQFAAWPSWPNKHSVQFVTTHTSDSTTLVTLEEYDLTTATQTTLVTFSNTTVTDIAQLSTVANTSVLVLLVDGTLNQYQIVRELDNQTDSQPKLLALDVSGYSLASNDDLLYYTQANTVRQYRIKTRAITELALIDATNLMVR